MNKIIGLFFISTIFLFTSCTKDEVTEIIISETSLTLTINQSTTISAEVTGNGDLSGFPVTWTSSDTSCVSVEDGVITALSAGIATITAKSGEKTATCEVTVNNEIICDFNQAISVYYGDALSTSTSNVYLIAFAGENDTIYFYLNTSLDTDTIPAGTYEMLTSINVLTDLVPYSIIPGMDNYYYSWYFGETENPIETGNVIISSVNSVYSVEFTVVDYYGNTIYGTYNGYMTHYDKSKIKTENPSTLLSQKVKTNFNRDILSKCFKK